MKFRVSSFGFRVVATQSPRAWTLLNSKPKTQNPKPSSRAQRGSVLIVIMVTLIFTALALTAFIEKAGNDLIAEARDADARRLRQEAYSALHTTLAVLDQFRLATKGLHSPAEGWSDPLGFAGYTPSEGRTIEVSFEDESGKMSLPQANLTQLKNLFVAWAMPPADAERLADAMLGWMKKNYTYTTPISPDYEHAAVPYVSPQRPLRSYQELAVIEYARTVFFDENGRPTDLYRKFTEGVSLFNFKQTNLNAAHPDVLTAIGEFDDGQQRLLSDYLNGTGAATRTGPAWFTAAADARQYLGPTGNTNSFGTTISALRIRLTVHDGRSEFRLNVVAAPSGGGATTVQTTATATRANAAADQPGATAAPTTAQPSSVPTPAAATAAAAKKLNFPFTLLEIRENDAPPPPAPPAPTL